jgi:imidazolonepropionase-like amidohydrolase
VLGLAEEIGTLRPGKRADLLAVAGDATREITRPRAVRLAVAGGRVRRRTNDGR